MKTFKYNTDTGSFATVEAFLRKRLKGNWVDVELTEAQAREIEGLIVADRNLDRKLRWRGARQTSSDQLLDEHDWEVVDHTADIQAQIEEADSLEQLLAPLTQERRELVLLYYRDGFTLAEIGRHFGITERAAGMRLETILGQLRKIK